MSAADLLVWIVFYQCHTHQTQTHDTLNPQPSTLDRMHCNLTALCPRTGSKKEGMAVMPERLHARPLGITWPHLRMSGTLWCSL